MGGLSIWHWLLLAVVAMLFLGKGRFSDFMGDAAKGIKSFKKGMAEDDEAHRPAPPAAAPAPRLQVQPPLDPGLEREPQPMKDDRPHA